MVKTDGGKEETKQQKNYAVKTKIFCFLRKRKMIKTCTDLSGSEEYVGVHDELKDEGHGEEEEHVYEVGDPLLHEGDRITQYTECSNYWLSTHQPFIHSQISNPLAAEKQVTSQFQPSSADETSS